MELFSSISANPRIVVSLFPPVIAGEWSQHDEQEEIRSKSSDPAENGASPVVVNVIPDGVRASLESSRKDGESDTSSILSKHTEISPSGPPGMAGCG